MYIKKAKIPNITKATIGNEKRDISSFSEEKQASVKYNIIVNIIIYTTKSRTGIELIYIQLLKQNIGAELNNLIYIITIKTDDNDNNGRQYFWNRSDRNRI